MNILSFDNKSKPTVLAPREFNWNGDLKYLWTVLMDNQYKTTGDGYTKRRRHPPPYQVICDYNGFFVTGVGDVDEDFMLYAYNDHRKRYGFNEFPLNLPFRGFNNPFLEENNSLLNYVDKKNANAVFSAAVKWAEVVDRQDHHHPDGFVKVIDDFQPPTIMGGAVKRVSRVKKSRRKTTKTQKKTRRRRRRGKKRKSTRF